MIKGGYIIQPRVIQESDISVASPCIREIWNYLLREANSKDNKYGGYEIKRGQLFRTYDEIREGTKWYVGWRKMVYNENATKSAMKFLRDTQRITTMKKPGGVLITICKYDYYQNPKNYEATTEATTEATIEQPSSNQPPPDNNNNKKNKKNDKNKEEEPETQVSVPQKDFITMVIEEFSKAYEDEFKLSYTIVAPGKERSAAGTLVKIYKGKYPDQNTEEALAGLRNYFNSVMKVNDSYFRTNMSLSTLINKFNEINNTIKNGKYKGSGATDKELAELLAGKIGTKE